MYAKGTVQTSSTTGFGYVSVTPHLACSNQQPFVAHSTSALTTAYPSFKNGALGTTAVSNSEFDNSNFFAPNNTRYRVVSAGLRIRYIGTELDRGGQIILFMDPLHESVITNVSTTPATGKTLATVEGYTESKRFPVDRNWKTVLYRPVDDQDNQMQDASNFLNNGPFLYDTNAAGFYYLNAYIQAASPTSSLNFEWEVYVNLEFTGRNVRGRIPSHFDPSGFAAVHAATVHSNQLMPSDKPDGVRVTSFLEAAEHYLDHAISFGRSVGRIIGKALPAIEGAAMALL